MRTRATSPPRSFSAWSHTPSIAYVGRPGFMVRAACIHGAGGCCLRVVFYDLSFGIYGLWFKVAYVRLTDFCIIQL